MRMQEEEESVEQGVEGGVEDEEERVQRKEVVVLTRREGACPKEIP